MDQMWIPVNLSWRLNERHYGALQGLIKPETATIYGDEQVLIWAPAATISAHLRWLPTMIAIPALIPATGICPTRYSPD